MADHRPRTVLEDEPEAADDPRSRQSRRRLIKAAVLGGGVAAATVAGIGIGVSQSIPPDSRLFKRDWWHWRPPTPVESPTSDAPTGDAQPSDTPPSEAPTTEPPADRPPVPQDRKALLHTEDDFARMTERVESGAEPWASTWQLLLDSRHTNLSYRMRPTDIVVRGGEGTNVGQLFYDVHAAYQNALIWKIKGDTDHGDLARDILNGWSAELGELSGNADRFLMAGTQGYQFAVAADIMRDYDGFELDRFQTMLTDVFHPMNDHFLKAHNDACSTNYRNNWESCTLASIFAIGSLTDDQDKMDRAVDYFHNGDGNGSIMKAVPYLHEDGTLGQWEESGRDQPHTMGGIGHTGVLCELAWNRGIDLYGAEDNRFMKACEYVARYNRGEDVPYNEHSWQMGTNCDWRTEHVVSDRGRGNDAPVWALVRNHYGARMGYDIPETTAWSDRLTPESGGGHRGPNSGGYDHLGFGTLVFRQ